MLGTHHFLVGASSGYEALRVAAVFFLNLLFPFYLQILTPSPGQEEKENPRRRPHIDLGEWSEDLGASSLFWFYTQFACCIHRKFCFFENLLHYSLIQMNRNCTCIATYYFLSSFFVE